jgi:outer membrane protein assembly factor BamE (lipoprotein component of BamABCDE complex)
MRRAGWGAVVAVLAITLAGCNSLSTTRTHGYVLSDSALAQIPPGSSQEQVLVVMGTPSTTATINGEAFYYISQKTSQPLAFMKPSVVDQHVVAVYFDKDRKVQRVADYGLKDGIAFDFLSRTTPTSGVEQTFLQRALKAIL